MNLHLCHILLGSNVSAAYVRIAREQLTRLFSDITFAPERTTLPYGLKNPACFTNQTAQFSTILSPEEIRPVLKNLERRAGRTPEEKAQEIIRLDIDLVRYDDTILKEADWELFFRTAE